jgi:NAD(P)H-quinone oxidoreductase subunit 2
LGLVTSVISIYYYIRVVKMMVVKEPHEMSEAVLNYPQSDWQLFGMQPLRVGLIISLVATSVFGILSNPLFSLANAAVQNSPMLQATAVNADAKTRSLKAAAPAPQLVSLVAPKG